MNLCAKLDDGNEQNVVCDYHDYSEHYQSINNFMNYSHKLHVH